MMQGKEILLGVSGGIACYKSLELVRRLKDQGAQVQVVMTSAATQFVTPLSFESLSGRPVGLDLFSLGKESEIGHIQLAQRADLVILAPATANLLAKAALGLADDLLSTLLLASRAPLLLAPAMNSAMWLHPATQANLATLLERGAQLVPPEEGDLACGVVGPGRLAETSRILAAAQQILAPPGRLSGKRVLVTAGPTLERLDAVRYLSNFSSGKMGYALAEACRDQGGEVTLVSGPSRLPDPKGMEVIRVESAQEMHQAVMARAEGMHLIIKSAAVADYRAAEPNPHKTKKQEELTIKLVKNPDILQELGQKKKPGQVLVGFAAESQNLEEYARTKLQAKNLDLIVGNNILAQDAGFNVDQNRVILLDRQGSKALPLMSKAQVAQAILEHLAQAGLV